MTAFTGIDLGYTKGTLIQAKIKAKNEIGWGQISAANSIGILA